MNRFILLSIIPLLYVQTASSQGRYLPPTYHTNVRAADSLFKMGNYTLASEHYRKAFVAFDWSGTMEDRYNSARAFAFAGNKDSTIATLRNICIRSRMWEYPKVYADTAFNFIRSSPEFTDIINCLKANKEKYAPNFNYAWRHSLDSIHQLDQAIRKESPASPELEARRKAIDSSNLSFVSAFLDKYGWKGANEVGETGNLTLFLVIQHSPTAVQEKYLPLLKKAVMDKKARPDDLALLEDRLSVSKYGYQIYGSQLMTVNGVTTLSPVKDPANVNKRRAAVGLMPLEGYLKLFNISYTP